MRPARRGLARCPPSRRPCPGGPSAPAAIARRAADRPGRPRRPGRSRTQVFGQREYGDSTYRQPSDPGQDYGQASYGQDSHSQDSFGQGSYGPPSAYGQGSYGQDVGQRDYSQPGYGSLGSGQPGYGQDRYSQQDAGQRDYGQQDYAQQDYAQPGWGSRGSSAEPDQPLQAPGYQADAFSPPGYAPSGGSSGFGEPDRSYQQNPTAGYQPEAYPQRGYESSNSLPNGFSPGSYPPDAYGQNGAQGTYPQDAYGQNGTQGTYAQDAYGQNGTQGSYTQDAYGQNGTQGTYAQDAYGQPGYGSSGYGQYGSSQYGPGQAGYAPSGYPQSGYPQNGYSQDAYPQDGYRQDAYGRDSYAEPTFEPATAPAYDDAGPAPSRSERSGGPPRSGGPRQARLSGGKMVLYLGASILGVIVIVLLVVRLSKTGSNSTTGGSTTPPTTSSSAAAPASQFTLVQAPKVDNKYPLNLAAARTSTTLAASETVVARALHAAGGGHVTKDVVAMYDLTSVTSPSDSNFQAVSFLGYEGTFNENNVIAFEQTQLRFSRTVKAGPDGGKMICGYATTTGGARGQRVRLGHQGHLRPGPVHRRPDGGEVPGLRYLGPGGQGRRGGPRLAAPRLSSQGRRLTCREQTRPHRPAPPVRARRGGRPALRTLGKGGLLHPGPHRRRPRVLHRHPAAERHGLAAHRPRAGPHADGRPGPAASHAGL